MAVSAGLADEGRQYGSGRLSAGRGRSLAWHLTVLCVALVLPILVLAGFLVWSYADTERERIENEALRIAHDVAAASDRELAGLVATIEVLSLSRQLRAGDLDRFDELARDVHGLLGINVVLRDRQSQQLINTRVPQGQPLPTNVETESDLEALRTRRPVISNLFIGGVTRRPLFIVNVPVVQGGDVKYFLNLSMDPARVRDVILQAGLPAGWTAIVADRRGHIVAHSAIQDARVGERLPEPIGNVVMRREGVVRAVILDHGTTPVLAATSRSRLSGWTSTVIVPASAVSAPLRHSLLGFGGAGAAILALSLALAVMFARRIAEAVGALAVEAGHVGQSKPVRPLDTPVSEVNQLSLVLSDASRQREASEAALRISEERLKLAQSAGRIGMWDWDAKTGRAVCSDTYRVLYGLDAEGPGHADPEEWLAQVHPDDRARVLANREAALTSGRLENEYRIVRPDGSVRWIVDRAVAFFDEDGSLSRMVGANVDVTESKEATERTRELQFELLHAARLSAMGQMAASLAHELNQPLGASANFLGAARLALQSGEPDGPARALSRLERAAEQTVRAGAILRRLRDFIGRGETEKSIVDPRRLIEDAVALAVVGVRDARLRIRFEHDPDVPPIVVDRVQIQQVVFNLVRNALEATEGADPREIVLATRVAGRAEVEISVSDSGPGFEGEPERLFKPFVSSKPRGMGIGLSICRAIVEAHHGRLWAERRPEGGAVFRFVVPAARETGGNR